MNHLSFPHKGKAGCVRVPLFFPLWKISVSSTRDTYQLWTVPYPVHCLPPMTLPFLTSPSIQAAFSAACPLHMPCRISASTYPSPPFHATHSYLPFLPGPPCFIFKDQPFQVSSAFVIPLKPLPRFFICRGIELQREPQYFPAVCL